MAGGRGRFAEIRPFYLIIKLLGNMFLGFCVAMYVCARVCA